MKTNNDPIHLLAVANPVPDHHRLADGPEQLLEDIIRMEQHEQERTKRPRRVRRSVLLAAAAAALVGSIGAAIALSNPSQTTRIACGGENIIDATSGDPIADCAAELRRLGIEPISLVAYDNGRGAVTVLESDSSAASGLTPLGEGFVQDTAIIELRQGIDDVATGVESGCFTNDEATEIVARELTASGVDWPITYRTDDDLTLPTCAVAMVLPEEQTVLIAQLERGSASDSSSEPPYAALVAQLNAALDGTCMNLNDAARTTVDLAYATDTQHMVNVHPVDDPESACTIATVNVGGAVEVTLRGPADGPIDPINLPVPMP